MAVDAGLAGFRDIFGRMVLGRLATLLVESHGGKAVASAASCRVHILKVLPHDLSHAQFVLLEFGRRVDPASQVSPDVNPGIEMGHQAGPQLGGQMAICTGGPDAKLIRPVWTVFELLEGYLHFMA